MEEDSDKNLRATKALGIRTSLPHWKGLLHGSFALSRNCTKMNEKAKVIESTKKDEAPNESDPAVDEAVEVVSEMLRMCWPNNGWVHK